MKRYILIAFVTAFTLGVWAQNEQDALRFSQTFYGGSARSVGMGGAFGALGGDFGALSTNPAGIAMYRQGEFSITPSFGSITNQALFLGNNTNDSQYKSGINQFGFVLPFGSRSGIEEGSNKVVFGFGYNRLKDFSGNIVMQGVNNQNSLVDEFVYTANIYDDWDPFTDGLAWETYLIDYDSIAGVFYSDFDVSGYGQDQRRSVNTRGSLGEFIFSMGANLSHKLYVGGSFGIQRAEYEETWTHYESDPDDIIDYFNAFSWRNNLYTTGRGFNAKLGFIARPVEYIRIGGALHTPTFFKMNDDFTSVMETDLDDGEPIHEYDAYGEYTYEITTPFRAIGSLAFMIKQMGLISIDYEYVDYASARLIGSDYDFFEENQAISNRYRAASNIRLGGEVHFGPLFLRGGYALYGTPYVSGEPNDIQVYQAISGGLGYRTSGFFLDLAIVRSGFDQKYFLYNQTAADITNTKLQFLGTVGFRF
jgi:hypothetical protein